MSRTRNHTLAAALVGAALVVAGCGGSPTGEGEATDTNSVVAEIAALPAAEQRDKAIELAKEESGKITLYTSLTTKIAESIGAEFTKKYGIDIEIYQGNSETVLQKVLQEGDAGRKGADVVDSNFGEMTVLENKKMLTPYAGPSLETFPQKSQFGSWYAERYNIILPAWNTDIIEPGQEPTSWEDLADSRFKGKLVLEIGDADWYASVTKYWLDEGKSQDEVDALWAKIAANAKSGKGHTTVIEMVSAGQYGIMASQYTYIADLYKDKGAPVDYRDASGQNSMPAFARPNGIGMVANSKSPASSWLFTDWILSDEGQQAVADAGITPAKEVPGDDSYDGLQITDYDVEGLSDAAAMKNWEVKYDELTREAGSAS